MKLNAQRRETQNQNQNMSYGRTDRPIHEANKYTEKRNSELRISINADRDSNKTQCNVRNKPLHNKQNQFYTLSVAKQNKTSFT